MTGPQVQRLRHAVAPAEHALLVTAQIEWKAGADLLDAIAKSLENAAPHISDQIGETGKAAADAFTKVSAKVAERSGQMRAASTALLNAAAALKAAQDARDYIDAHPPLDPGPRPTVSPGVDQSHDDINQMRAWSARKSAADSTASDHETRARIAADHLDTVYQDSTETMKQVHGEPDPVPPVKNDSQGGGGSGGTAPSGGGSTAPVSGGGKHPAPATATITSPHHDTTTVTWDPHQPVHHDPPSDPGDPTTTVDPWLPPGSEQGDGSTGPSIIGGVPGGGGSVSTTSGTSGLGATGGVLGALGGGAMGGLTGVSGAVRGTSVVPTGGAAGTGGRAIGSTSRTGATGSALGRGTTAESEGSATGARGGARSAGGGTRAAGKAGSRGAAGSRGSAGGGQGGRNKKDPRKKGTDFFEEEQDWVDDEGAAPGVID